LLLKYFGGLISKSGKYKQQNSCTPAAYTYFGQLNAHDFYGAIGLDNRAGHVNVRTPVLDLDSMFGLVDADDSDSAEPVIFVEGLGIGVLAMEAGFIGICLGLNAVKL